MSKYDFALKVTDDTALGSIAARINAGSDVLEFGAATGRFTEYLKGEGCRVSIVEIDAEAAAVASQFAEKSFVGDIEKYEWEDCFSGQSFDYIIFADVLEHLYDPSLVLQRVQKYLKKGGRIVVSIPNIAHNSIIINLINNRFPYSEVGLLDNTHIRFFTIKELESFFAKSGLKAVDYNPTLVRVEDTELPFSYDDVAPEVASFLKKRAGGDVYQHVFSLECKESESDRDGDIFAQELESLAAEKPRGFSQLFWTEDPKVGFSEENSLRFPLDESNKQNLRIELQGGVVAFRLDPLNGPCSARGIKVHLECDGEQYLLEPKHNKNVLTLRDTYYFPSHDPRMFYEISPEQQQKDLVLLIDFTILNDGESLFESSIPAIGDYSAELKKIHEGELNAMNDVIEEQQTELEARCSVIEKLTHELRGMTEVAEARRLSSRIKRFFGRKSQ